MKKYLTYIALLTSCICYGQSLPIDFESSINTSSFIDFDGGTAQVIDNPHNSESNSSNKVAQIIRDGGAIWAGSKILLSDNLDFSTDNTLTMKVFTSAPIGTIIKFKLEGDGSDERDIATTVSNQWEELTWDFTGTASKYNALVFMFDFGNTGNGTENSTFLFDDIEQIYGGQQIDLPVDFEGNEINYTLTDFEGNTSALLPDPTDQNNTVVQCIKTSDASPSAGTTIGTPAGFATDIPLTLTNSKMTVKVWTPSAGTPVRLKVEDSKDPTHTCETQTNTTVAGWEILEFDFLNQATGTELLSVGLQQGWTYNMASIFFNFAVSGAQDGGQSYYFDDVRFGGLPSTTIDLESLGLIVAPNPSSDNWKLTSVNNTITKVEILDISGSLLQKHTNSSQAIIINSESFLSGIYVAKITTDNGIGIIRLIKN